jgi:hypothetical protein
MSKHLALLNCVFLGRWNILFCPEQLCKLTVGTQLIENSGRECVGGVEKAEVIKEFLQ